MSEPNTNTPPAAQTPPHRGNGAHRNNGRHVRPGRGNGQPQPRILVPNPNVDAAVVQAIMLMDNNALQQEVWSNHRSGHIYKVTRLEGEGLERRVNFVRVGQNDGFSLPLASFAIKYRPANKEELLQNLVAALRAANPEGDDNGEVSFIVEPDHRHDFDRIILAEETLQAIKMGLNKIVNREALEAVWGLSQIEPRTKRAVLNFYGPPGVGKTLAALAVAKKLGKKLMQVDYSQIISKYTGETAKHIALVFKQAKEQDAMIFWDEADALLSKRISGENTDQSFATSINQNRNVLMQELDRFDGVVVMATNLFRNYDEAMVRRIAQHVPFNLPNAEMRTALFKLHLPRKDRIEMTDLDWADLGVMTEGLAGGDILNVVMNAINHASLSEDPATWKLTKKELVIEAHQIMAAKAMHKGKKLNPVPAVPTAEQKVTEVRGLPLPAMPKLSPVPTAVTLPTTASEPKA